MEGVTLYHGDCLEIMRGMADKSVDLILTDPPYGIADVWKGGASCGWGRARLQTETRNAWDNSAPSKEVFSEIIRIGVNVVIWGGNYFELPPSRGWLVWNKPERGFSLSEAELAWTNCDNPIRVLDCHRSDSDREHPTQKPLKLMKWVLSNFSMTNETIFDPFMGSGTTGVACMQMGRRFIGAEINKEYFDMAKRRIENTQRPLPMINEVMNGYTQTTF